MKSESILFTICLVLSVQGTAEGYVDGYSPYSAGDKNIPNNIRLVDLTKSEYVSSDVQIKAELMETPNSYHFLLKDGDRTLMDLESKEVPLPCAVFEVDVDGNGQRDFIVFSNYRGVGLFAEADKVDLFLKIADSQYRQISYDTIDASIEDFSISDGKVIVAIADLNNGEDFSYSRYKIENYKLVNADSPTTAE